MNWRRTFLTGILAAGLAQATLPFASTAWADNDHDHHNWYHEHWTAQDREVATEFLELDGTGTADAENLVSESAMRGFWGYYRQIMGL